VAEAPNNKVQLGCGTLIVIAIIVAIFSGDRGTSRLRTEVGDLRQQVQRLETKIDQMSAKIDKLSESTAAERPVAEVTAK
jgi:cell division protein FtsL